ncbi:MAG: ribokinase [Pseudomonadota bacterium]
MAQKKLCVLGSLNVDIVARVTALPRPGETVQGSDLTVLLGGKGANQAVAAARVGADVAMFGAIGDQNFGLDIISLMRGYGVNTDGIAPLEGATGTALIAVDVAGENAITVSPGANGRVEDVTLPDPPEGACILAQMETPPELTAKWFAAGKSAGCTTILNAAPALRMPDGLMEATDVLIVNETECAAYTGRPLTEDASEQDVLQAAMALRIHADQIIIVTLGKRGAVAVTRDDVLFVPALSMKVRDTTGAGDCFCGTFAAMRAMGAALDQALTFAAAAAAVSVTRDGAAPSMPIRADVEAVIAAAANTTLPQDMVAVLSHKRSEGKD